MALVNAEANKERREERFRYLTSVARIAIFYFLGLSLFFIAGFLIITLRVSVKSKVTVPAVVGKLFLDEYNRLEELGLKIKLEPYHSVEYPLGFILAQSLPAGKVVNEGAKLTLLVNQSETVVPVPLLVGIAEGLVESMLSNIPVGGRTFKLQRGVVTRIPSEKPPGEVLEQHPPAGTMVVPQSPVSILVSAGPLAKGQSLNMLAMQGISVRIAARAAYELKKPLVFGEVVSTENLQEDGLVTVTAVTEELVAKLWRYQFPPTWDNTLAQDELPYRFVWLAPRKIGVGKTVTLVSKVGTNPNSQEQSFWYLKIQNNPIPLFLRTEEEIKVYEGFFQERSIGETTPLPTGATSLLAEEVKEGQEVKPLKTITLRSGDI